MMAARSPKTRHQYRQTDSDKLYPDLARDSEDETDVATPNRSDSDDETPLPVRHRAHKNASQSSPGRVSDESSTPQHHSRSHASFNSSYGSRASSGSPGSPLYPSLDTPPSNESSGRIYVKREGAPSPRSNLNNSSNLNQSSRKATSESNALIMMIVLALIFVVICVFLSCSSGGTNTEEYDDTVTPFEHFLKGMSNLEQIFPGQGRRMWKTVKATAKHVLNETDPLYPSIILMGVEVGNSHLASCIANKIASGFESSLGQSPAGQKTNIEAFRHLDAAEQKMRLDEAFQRAFHTSQSSSLLVENLQLLSAEAALLLYGYCDNDNAPYRNVLILLTVNVQPGEITLDPRQPSNVEAYLSNIWRQSMDRDKVDALMSRVANNIVIISQETDEVFQKECAS